MKQMSNFRYESVFVHAAFQYCGHIDAYFCERSHRATVIYFQTRFAKGGHLLKRYEEGQLVEERWLSSAQHPFPYYFLYGWHHTRELLRFARGRKEPTLVIFTHPVACFGMTLVRLLRRVKYVFWVWDYFPPASLLLRTYEAFKRHCVRRCDYAFGVSPALCAHYDPKIRLVHLGVTDPTPTPNTQNQKPEARNPKRILFVGQLRAGQGIESLLEFIAANPAYSLTIVGGAANDFDKVINTKIAELKIADRVRFPNRFVSDAELRAEAAPCFCGLALYDTDPNNFTHYADPGKVKSYLEMSLPVVMTRISHTAKLLEEFHAGEVINALADLPAAVAKIAADPTAYTAGVQAFTTRFNYRTYYDAEFAILARIGAIMRAATTNG